MTFHNILGYAVSGRGAEGDVNAAMAWLTDGQRQRVVSTLNAHSACMAADDPAFATALKQADVLIPDGMSVVWAGRLLGKTIPERVSGFDFFSAFSKVADAKGGISYFFLGSSDEVLARIVARLKRDYPNIRIAGTLSPPFKATFTAEDNAAMRDAINAARPDVLWVGMTAPKQEKWIEEQRANLDIGFATAIGAVFDFYAETKSRAPLWAQKSGLEWMHRLISEPKRVWRRYILNNPRFVWMVMKAMVKAS